MSYSKRSRYSLSPVSYDRYRRSVSRSRSSSRSRSRSLSPDVENPGNSLYVTGLSTRITKRDLIKHFSTEGEVSDVHLVVDPWTRQSRGFGFITMSSVEDANRCIKYLDSSVLDGRVITVEKSRRRRGRTPTPGKYLGLRTSCGRRRSSSSSRRSYSSHRRSYSRSPSRSRSPSPYYRRRRDYSPYYSRRRRSYSPDGSFDTRDGSLSPNDDGYHGSHRYRSVSRSPTPPRRRSSRRSYYSPSASPIRRRRSARRSYYSPSLSPIRRRRQSSRRSYSRSYSPRPRRSYYSRSLSRSCSVSSQSSRSVSRSPTPRSPTPSS
ncbi:serine/arginine-rich splicing factor SR45a-like [Rutidosis leptorrhynchoides]|uniref:serine/arginine-rich splicing factor SR45a-like n=1 Tax=Rutidosis leptorrhynchoides TaxID=125765 RepID=UPI003A9A23B5